MPQKYPIAWNFIGIVCQRIIDTILYLFDGLYWNYSIQVYSHDKNSIAIRSGAIHLNSTISCTPSQGHHILYFLIREDMIRLVYGNIDGPNIVDGNMKTFTYSQPDRRHPLNRNHVISWLWDLEALFNFGEDGASTIDVGALSIVIAAV